MIYVVFALLCSFAYTLGYIIGRWMPRVTFHEPTFTSKLEDKKASKSGSVLFAEPLTPTEAFKESKTIDDFINKI